MTTSHPEPDWKNYYQLEADLHDFSESTDHVEIHRCLAAWSVFPKKLKNFSLLDTGCGNGYFCHWIADRTAAVRVAGCDISKSRIEMARQRYPTFDFQVAELAHLPWPDHEFDVVTCIEVLEHLRDPEIALRELMRVSRRYVVVTVPDRQPIRMMLCPHCGKTFPMYGHLQFFNSQRLATMLRLAGGRVEIIKPFFAARGLRSGVPMPLARLLGWIIGRISRGPATFLAARTLKEIGKP